MEPNSQTGEISGKLLSKLRGVSSAYPDNFDYSIYDSLFAKFGDSQPRGGVVFKTAFRLANYHTSCSKCHYAFEIDTYGRGCTHNCGYCYALELLTGHGYWNRPHPLPVDMSEIRRVFATVFESDRKSKWRAVMEKRTPIRIGSMSDSFMKMDRKYRVTYELLKILRFYRYPYVIFTRSNLVADDEYLEVMDRDLAAIQFSISGGDESLTKKIEPGAPSVEERLLALEKLVGLDYWTAVRINPFFPPFPDGYFTDKENIIKRFGSYDSVPRFPLFDMSFVDEIANTGVPSVLVGVGRLSPIAINNLARATGINLKVFFKPELCVGAGDRHYSDAEINHYYQLIHSACKSKGIRFTTCYIGNGIKDYYSYQRLWSNPKDCCDVRGNVRAFETSSQEIPWSVRQQFAPCASAAEESRNQEVKADKVFENKVWN